MGRIFVSNPSKQYLKTVEMLEGLLGDENNEPVRAYAAAVYEKSRNDWVAKNNLRQSGGHSCLNLLVGKRCYLAYDWPLGRTKNHKHGGLSCFPPGADHCSLWLRDGKPAVFVMQPYDLDGDMLFELVNLCRENNFHLEIKTWPAWHFPGAALMVEIWRKDSLPTD